MRWRSSLAHLLRARPCLVTLALGKRARLLTSEMTSEER